MVDLSRPIFLMLNSVAPVKLEFPNTKAKFPLITIAEVANVEEYSVDGMEQISDITYQVDVWDNGDDLQHVNELASDVSTIMTQNHFTRILGRGFKDPVTGLQRKMMYFKALSIN